MLYNAAKHFFSFWFRCMNRLIVRGEENIINDGPAVICANHYSDSDVFILSALFRRQIFFLAKKQLFDAPVVKHLAKAYGAIAVDRDAKDFASILTAVRTLRNGNQLGIFPEGTRIRNGKVSEPKGGAVMIAYLGKAPILPVRIETKNKHFHTFNRYTVTIGKPMTCEQLGIVGKDPEGFRQAADRLMEHIYGL